MRKMIWCTAILGVVATAGVYVAARHAAQTPDCFLGRCLTSLVGKREIKAAPVAVAPGTARTCILGEGAHGPQTAVRRCHPPEVTEPIVVEPAAPEPLTLPPALSPEITAAIERIRAAEEGESHLPMAFLNDNLLRMPLADEEELPQPRSLMGLDIAIELDLHQGLGLFFFPTACWKTTAELVLDIFRDSDPATTSTTPSTNEEAAEEGATPADNCEDETIEPDLYRRIHEQHYHQQYHQNHCPYHGGCPAPYHYRAPRPLPAPVQEEAEELPEPRQVSPEAPNVDITSWLINFWFGECVQEDVRQLRGEWIREWIIDQPNHLTPIRVHGGFGP